MYSRRCQVPRNHDFRALNKLYFSYSSVWNWRCIRGKVRVFSYFVFWRTIIRSGNMYSDGHEVDGSWVLRVYVTDLQVERSLRVKGELHIGGVMLRLVEDLGESTFRFFYNIAYDWYIIFLNISNNWKERVKIENSNDRSRIYLWHVINRIVTW